MQSTYLLYLAYKCHWEFFMFTACIFILQLFMHPEGFNFEINNLGLTVKQQNCLNPFMAKYSDELYSGTEKPYY